MTVLEREAQLAAAEGCLAEAATGHGRLVYVAGEPGVGKTTFLEHLLTHSDARPLIGWCDGSATPPPLGPLTDMLPDLPADVWSEGASRSEVFAGLLATLRRPPQAAPYLMVVEDAHWADEATLDLLRHLARRIHSCRAVVMVSYRPEDTAPGDGLRLLLGDTAGARGVRRLDLSPLTERGVERLAAEHGVPAAGLYDVTGGNPFFVTEALSAETSEVPSTVRDAVLARASRLKAPGRRALDVVALTGSRADMEMVGTLLNAGPTALDEPLARGLLRQSGRDVLFRHELARLAIADEIPPGRRLHLHRLLLAALSERGAGAAVLAHHADAAGDGPAALVHARRAAAEATVLGATWRRPGSWSGRCATPRTSRPQTWRHCCGTWATSTTSSAGSRSRSPPSTGRGPCGSPWARRCASGTLGAASRGWSGSPGATTRPTTRPSARSTFSRTPAPSRRRGRSATGRRWRCSTPASSRPGSGGAGPSISSTASPTDPSGRRFACTRSTTSGRWR